MRRRAIVLFFLFLALTTLACKKKAPIAGAACTKEGDFVCATNTKRMVCTTGKWIEETCSECTQKKGFGSSSSFYAGCIAGGIGPEGSACIAEDSADCDGTQLVKCKGGTYHRYPCGGAGGCTRTLTGISCDSSIGVAGNACREEDAASCSPDKKAMLHCRSGKLVSDRVCKGPKACVVTDQEKKGGLSLECDTTVGDVGDPCGGTNGACSSDKSEVIACKDGKYVAISKCRGADPHCKQVGDKVECAESGVSEVGDPCGNGGACTADGKALLQCENGAFRQRMKCKSCKVNGDDITCKH